MSFLHWPIDITYFHRQGMGCFLWVQSLVHVLLIFITALLYSIQLIKANCLHIHYMWVPEYNAWLMLHKCCPKQNKNITLCHIISSLSPFEGLSQIIFFGMRPSNLPSSMIDMFSMTLSDMMLKPNKRKVRSPHKYFSIKGALIK